ncbi:MAG TPA: LLM class flavin-dependent oxidoreductase [Nitrososphaerales archaeon]|nr:LLM class flavin-dependent oxidoreductase [Nitrososphaerales archaeon]
MTSYGILIPTTLQQTPSTHALEAFIRRADELGFHSLWTLDRVLQGDPVLDGVSVLTFAAAITRRVKLGTSVLLTTLRNPILVAKTLSTIDYLSNGRLLAGLSAGGRKYEFDSLGIPTKGRGVRLAETVKILRVLWREPKVNFSGKFFTLKGVEMFPKPMQDNIPILIGGSSAPALDRAGRIGDGFIATIRGSPDTFKRECEQVRAGALRSERDPDKLDYAKLVYVYAGTNKEECYLKLKSWADRFYQTDFDVKSNCIYGAPDECAEKIKAYERAGAKTIILGPPTSDLEQIELLRDQVLASV